jgi:hypothetical protein
MMSRQEVAMCKKFDGKIAVREARISEMKDSLKLEQDPEKALRIEKDIAGMIANIASFNTLRDKFNCDCK